MTLSPGYIKLSSKAKPDWRSLEADVLTGFFGDLTNEFTKTVNFTIITETFTVKATIGSFKNVLEILERLG